MDLGSCEYTVSPGLLKRCSLYRRNGAGVLEKCWDFSAHSDLPESARLTCPNHTGRRALRAFTAADLVLPYPGLAPPKTGARVPFSPALEDDRQDPELDNTEEEV